MNESDVKKHVLLFNQTTSILLPFLLIDLTVWRRLRLINQYAGLLWHFVDHKYQYTFIGSE